MRFNFWSVPFPKASEKLESGQDTNEMVRHQRLVSPLFSLIPPHPSLAGQETNDPEHGENQHSQNENTKVERQEDDTQVPNTHLQHGSAKMESAYRTFKSGCFVSIGKRNTRNIQIARSELQ